MDIPIPKVIDAGEYRSAIVELLEFKWADREPTQLIKIKYPFNQTINAGSYGVEVFEGLVARQADIRCATCRYSHVDKDRLTEPCGRCSCRQQCFWMPQHQEREQ